MFSIFNVCIATEIAITTTATPTVETTVLSLQTLNSSSVNLQTNITQNADQSKSPGSVHPIKLGTGLKQVDDVLHNPYVGLVPYYDQIKCDQPGFLYQRSYEKICFNKNNLYDLTAEKNSNFDKYFVYGIKMPDDYNGADKRRTVYGIETVQVEHRSSGLAPTMLYPEVYFKLGTPVIKLYGLSDEYKGEIGFDLKEKTIVFFGNDQQFHTYFNGKDASSSVYYNITIKNQKQEIIQEILINGTDSMMDTISKYRIPFGIKFEYGNIIELQMAEPHRTHVKMNETNEFVQILNEPNYATKKFIIIRDQLLAYEFYEHKYLRLFLEWKQVFQSWVSVTKDQSKRYYPTLSAEAKTVWKQEKYVAFLGHLLSFRQNMQIIQDGEHIRTLEIEVQHLGKVMRETFNI